MIIIILIAKIKNILEEMLLLQIFCGRNEN